MSPELETDRLLLRHWRANDMDTWIAMGSDANVMQFFPAKLSDEQGRAAAERFADKLHSEEYGLWAVEVKNGEPFIGFIGLSVQDVGISIGSFIEIGWRLKQSAWGKGFATEGAKRILEHGFKTCNLERIYSMTSKINLPSRRVMEKIGMVEQDDLAFRHPKISLESALSEHVIYSANNPIY